MSSLACLLLPAEPQLDDPLLLLLMLVLVFPYLLLPDPSSPLLLVSAGESNLLESHKINILNLLSTILGAEKIGLIHNSIIVDEFQDNPFPI